MAFISHPEEWFTLTVYMLFIQQYTQSRKRQHRTHTGALFSFATHTHPPTCTPCHTETHSDFTRPSLIGHLSSMAASGCCWTQPDISDCWPFQLRHNEIMISPGNSSTTAAARYVCMHTSMYRYYTHAHTPTHIHRTEGKKHLYWRLWIS